MYQSSSGALLVGLNYVTRPTMRLNGCWNDAIGLHSLLTSIDYGMDAEDVELLIDTKPSVVPETTKAALREKIVQLAKRSWPAKTANEAEPNGDEAEPGLAMAVFTFSGHGAQQRDYSGDEADGLDEGICPSDCMSTGLLLDDELRTLLGSFHPKTRVFAVFDCCHSGSIVDLQFQFPESTPKAFTSRGEAEAAAFAAKAPHIVVLSGCCDSQTSADAYNRKSHKYGGALTMALLDVLQRPKSSALGLRELHREVLAVLQAQGHPQYPLISSTRPIDDEVSFFRLKA